MIKKRKEFDKDAYRELDLYVDNDYPTYQRTSAYHKALVKRYHQGNFNNAKAQKGFYNLVVVPASRKYVKEYGSGRAINMFPKDVREAVAKNKLRSFLNENKYGNYDNYIPKKYQKKKTKPLIWW
jgi:hypothetical protein